MGGFCPAKTNWLKRLAIIQGDIGLCSVNTCCFVKCLRDRTEINHEIDTERFLDKKHKRVPIGNPGSSWRNGLHLSVTTLEEALVLLFGLAKKLAKLRSGLGDTLF